MGEFADGAESAKWAIKLFESYYCRMENGETIHNAFFDRSFRGGPR
jgi:hypothetical protein